MTENPLEDTNQIFFQCRIKNEKNWKQTALYSVGVVVFFLIAFLGLCATNLISAFATSENPEFLVKVISGIFLIGTLAILAVIWLGYLRTPDEDRVVVSKRGLTYRPQSFFSKEITVPWEKIQVIEKFELKKTFKHADTEEKTERMLRWKGLTKDVEAFDTKLRKMGEEKIMYVIRTPKPSLLLLYPHQEEDFVQAIKKAGQEGKLAKKPITTWEEYWKK